jgi:hypothetical protein
MNKKTSLLFLSFFSIIILFQVVSSVQPTVTVTSPLVGINIKAPMTDLLKVNKSFDFNFHLFNASDGLPLDNTTIQCYFHLYNSSGDHIYTEISNHDLNSDHFVPNEWVSRIDGGNFSELGLYAYILQCNNSLIGGNVESPLEVRPDLAVEILTTSRGILYFGVLFILTILFGFCVYNVTINENLGWKLGFLSTAYVILMGLTYSLLSISRAFLFEIPTFEIIFNTLWIILVPGFFVYVLGIIIYLIFTALKEQEIKSFVARGFSEEEARSKTRDK